MARYIDVEALKNDGHPCWHDGKGNIYYEVDHAPTADVVAVVRCKDCKYWAMRQKGLLNRYVGYCCNNDFPFTCESLPCTSEDDFCSYGERSDT